MITAQPSLSTHYSSNRLTVNSHSLNCPNCGHADAERHYLSAEHLVRTQCPQCDYLMITCSHTGNVVEAYAPGLPLLR